MIQINQGSAGSANCGGGRDIGDGTHGTAAARVHRYQRANAPTVCSHVAERNGGEPM